MRTANLSVGKPNLVNGKNHHCNDAIISWVVVIVKNKLAANIIEINIITFSITINKFKILNISELKNKFKIKIDKNNQRKRIKIIIIGEIGHL